MIAIRKRFRAAAPLRHRERVPHLEVIDHGHDSRDAKRKPSYLRAIEIGSHGSPYDQGVAVEPEAYVSVTVGVQFLAKRLKPRGGRDGIVRGHGNIGSVRLLFDRHARDEARDHERARKQAREKQIVKGRISPGAAMAAIVREGLLRGEIAKRYGVGLV